MNFSGMLKEDALKNKVILITGGGSPPKKDTNHKKYFTIQYLSNEEKSFS